MTASNVMTAEKIHEMERAEEARVDARFQRRYSMAMIGVVAALLGCIFSIVSVASGSWLTSVSSSVSGEDDGHLGMWKDCDVDHSGCATIEAGGAGNSTITSADLNAWRAFSLIGLVAGPFSMLFTFLVARSILVRDHSGRMWTLAMVFSCLAFVCCLMATGVFGGSEHFIHLIESNGAKRGAGWYLGLVAWVMHFVTVSLVFGESLVAQDDDDGDGDSDEEGAEEP